MKPLFYVIAAAAAAALIAALRAWSRWRKERKKSAEISHITRRNEALNEALRDPYAKGPVQRGPEGPLEISWDDKAVHQSAAAGSSLLIELIELSAYSRRKYVFRADRPISIGSGPDNQMVLPREGVAEKHCEIRMTGKRACVRSMSRAQTSLKRKKMVVLVGTEGIYLNNGDHIQLGTSEIQFRLFKA